MMDLDKTLPGPAPTIVGDFRLVRELGTGGFGTVYEAIQLKTGITYAVKRLNKAADPERFRKEALYPARAAARSLHVLNTHSFFEGPDGTCYIVTDFMRHGDLGSFVKTHGPLSLETMLEIGIGIAKGLAAIHEDGIVHLDLKPVNVLMDRKDDQWIPKIADFGLARSTVSQVHNDGLTVAYASPEHFDTRVNRTWASDMFSFGMLLYELLTGRKACGDATDLTGYFTWIKQAVPPPAPSGLSPDLKERADLDTLVDGLLVFDIARRTVSATAALQALEAARSHRLAHPQQTVVAKPGPPAVPPRGDPQTPRVPHTPAGEVVDGVPRQVITPRTLPKAIIAAAAAVLVAAAAGGWWLLAGERQPDISEGMKRFNAGSYAEAFRLLLDPARDGRREAQRTVGRLYAKGLGVPRDPGEAHTWLDKAIDQDDAEARCTLADLYREGAFGANGGPEARRLYSAAAESHACGHHGLGDLLTQMATVPAQVPGAGMGIPNGLPGSTEGDATFDEGLRHYERAAEMGDTSAEQAVRELQANWTLPPLTSGAWQPVIGKERRAELTRLRREQTFEALKPFDPRRLRQLAIEFYDQTRLMELEVGRAPGETGVLSYLRRPDGSVLLSGQAAPINRLNIAAPLRIETAQRAMAYLRFYQSAAVQGRTGGLFRLIDEPSDLRWLPAAPQPVRDGVTRQLTRLRVDPSPHGGWQAEGTVAYNGSLFHTRFQVTPDGVVRVEPRQVTDVLPLEVERFDQAGVRLRVMATPSAQPVSGPTPTSGGQVRALETSGTRSF